MKAQRIDLADVHDICDVHGVVSGRNIMNSIPLSGKALERALAEKLRELLGGISWLQNVEVEYEPQGFNHAFDLLAKFQVPQIPAGKKSSLIELWVDCRDDPRPSLFPYVNRDVLKQATSEGVRVPVLAAPHISPRIAELCEAYGWNWFDLAGNCRLSIPGIIHLEYTGNRPLRRGIKPIANLGTKETGRVVRMLLTPLLAGDAEVHEPKRWTQRAMEMQCRPEVSLGLVNKVVRYLREEAFIEMLPDNGFRLSDPLKLLFAWRDAYRFNQNERHGYFTLLQGKQLREALARLGSHAVYAAFSAAEIQAPHVRQSKTWLYVANRELDRFAEIVKAKPVDSGENIEVLVPNDEGVFSFTDDVPSDDLRLRCTNPVQTYVDLWHCGGRGQEAAEAVLNQQLKPAWRNAGLKV